MYISKPSKTESESQSSAPFYVLLLCVAALALTGCPVDATSGEDAGTAGEDAGSVAAQDAGSLDEIIDRENPDWTEASHSNDVDPSYDEVFPDDRVRTLTLTFTAAQWALMQADLAALQSSTGGGGPGGPGGGAEFPAEDPMWGEATLTSDGVEWHHVGVRYKGNSSLRNAYESNSNKYPFKLDFDEWEDDYTSVDDQRFFGFKQLNLGSNFGDASFMREKVAADLFREFGVPSARTSFCEVFLDIGSGPERLGIYTIVEELDDSMTDAQFEDGSGNLYKPDGDAASFELGSLDTDEYELKTNKDVPDYADITALYNALHSTTRTTDEAAYTEGLEAVFDVDQYLRYLAANQAIQNWDTYGRMTHNYFLYNTGDRLTWIPWDNNEAFQQGKMGGALELDLEDVTDAWPMIRFIMDIPAYENAYQDNLEEFTGDVFLPSRMADVYDDMAEVLDAALADSERAQFTSAVADLKSHATSRTNAIDGYVNP